MRPKWQKVPCRMQPGEAVGGGTSHRPPPVAVCVSENLAYMYQRITTLPTASRRPAGRQPWPQLGNGKPALAWFCRPSSRRWTLLHWWTLTWVYDENELCLWRKRDTEKQIHAQLNKAVKRSCLVKDVRSPATGNVDKSRLDCATWAPENRPFVCFVCQQTPQDS